MGVERERERWGLREKLNERALGQRGGGLRETEREIEREDVCALCSVQKCVLNNQSCRPSVWSVRLQSRRSRSPLFYLLYFSVLRVTWL